MKPKILRTDAELHIAQRALDELRGVADVVTCESYQEDVLAEAAKDVELILTCYTEITAKVIESATKLKGIVKYGVGVDSIDLAAATRRNVLVANCPDYGSDTVADHAFALMICLARQIARIDRVMQQRAWAWPSLEYLGFDLSGKTLGLIGFGRIGRAMARRATGFGMDRVIYDPYVGDEVLKRCNVRRAGLEELLGISDFLSIPCVLTPETEGLLGEKQLRMMKNSAILVNVSRGAIVDEAALHRALRQRWIAGGGFDVFLQEPLKPDYPLLGMDNVILTPHFAWYTTEALKRVDRDTVEAVLDILRGKVPKNLKNREVLQRD